MKKTTKKYYTIYRYSKDTNNLEFVAQTENTNKVQKLFRCTLKHISDYKAKYDEKNDIYIIGKQTIEHLVLMVDYD